MTKTKQLTRGLHAGFTLPGHCWRILKNTEADDYQQPEDILQFNGAGRIGLVRVRERKDPLVPSIAPKTRDRIHAWTWEESQAKFLQLHSDTEAVDEFFARAAIDPQAVDAIREKAERLLALLMDLAEKGNRDAVNGLLHLTVTTCRRLREIRDSNPAVLEPTARYMEQWPVLMSTNPLLCDRWPAPGRISALPSDPARKQYEETCRAMNLGGGANRSLDRQSKWKPDAAADVAHGLVRYIRFRQIRLKQFPELGDPIASMVSELDVFTKDTASNWWVVAKRLLLHSYPKPEEIPELGGLITLKAHRKTPSDHRFRILKLIGERFKSVAPLVSPPS